MVWFLSFSPATGRRFRVVPGHLGRWTILIRSQARVWGSHDLPGARLVALKRKYLVLEIDKDTSQLNQKKKKKKKKKKKTPCKN